MAVLVVTIMAMNAVKPVTIDDTAYLHYADHLTRHPFDPYGFSMWSGRPANNLLVPLGLPYWLAGAQVLFGDEPWVLKLSLLPFVVLLVMSLYWLGQRFAPDLALPLTVMLALSPALLPSWNLMLDLPALALGLAAMLLFINAADRGVGRHAITIAIFSGVVAGVAMQVKYTSAMAVAAILLYGALHRRIGLAALTAAVSAALFWSVEAWIASLYGQSHFLLHLSQRHPNPLIRLRLALPLVTILGGVACMIILIQFAALRAKPRVEIAAGAAIATATALIVALPGIRLAHLPFATVCYAIAGVVLIAAGVACVLQLLKTARDGDERTVDVFLVGWLVIELLSYFAMSPFPAVRRVLALIVVLSFIVARLLARRALTVAAPRAWAAAAVGSVFGILVGVIDVVEARAHKRLAEHAAQWIAQRDPQPKIWVYGFFGLPYYAEKVGMKRLPANDKPAPGDWVVVDEFEDRGDWNPKEFYADLTQIERLTVDDALPLRTVANYYAGGSPVLGRSGPRAYVIVYRARDRVAGVEK